MKRYLILAAAFTLGVSAQTRLTLADAVNRAVTAHPLLKAGEERIAVSEGMRKQAGLGPNPKFVLQQENIRFSHPPPFQYWSDTDTFAFFQQTIETGGKRKRRKEAAGAGVRRAQLERELLRKQIAGRVKNAYWAVAGAQRVHELLLEAAKNFLLIVEYHQVRVREGAMAEADLLRIRLESERLHFAANTAFLNVQKARIRLFREMGEADIPESVLLEPLRKPDEEPLSADATQALEQRTEMKLARLGVEQAEAMLRLERANASPNVDAIVGYKRTAGLNTMLAGVQFDLPFRNRNQGNVAAAAARISAARAELASMAAVVRAEVAAARKGYEIRRRQIIESLQPMMKQAAESARISQAAYREGGWDLLRLLDAERLRIETQSLYYQALAAYRQSIAELETAMGVEP